MIRGSDRRLAAVLLGQAGCRQAGEGAEVHLSQAELGEMTKLSRHPVASILAGFAARGWVECGYQHPRTRSGRAARVRPCGLSLLHGRAKAPSYANIGVEREQGPGISQGEPTDRA